MTIMVLGVLDPLGGDFAVGVQLGIGALGAGFLLGALWGLRRRAVRLAPVAGAVFAVGACLALRETVGLPDGLVWGALVLACGGLLVEALGAWWVTSVIPAIPGAWLVATQSDLIETSWIRWVVGCVAIGGGALAGEFDRRWGREGYGPVLLAVSVVGVYYTVPDTEQAVVVLGAALPLVLVGWPWPVARLGFPGALAAWAVVAWVIGAGGPGRESSVVGGAACLGLFVLEPVARLFLPRGRSVLEHLGGAWWSVPAVAAIHLAFVFAGSRVAGLRPTVGEAIAVVTFTGAAGVAILVGAGMALGRPEVQAAEERKGERVVR